MTEKIRNTTHYQLRSPCHEIGDVIDDRVAGAIEAGVPPDVLQWYVYALGYLGRWYAKDGLQDLEKTQECISRMMDALRRDAYV